MTKAAPARPDTSHSQPRQAARRAELRLRTPDAGDRHRNLAFALSWLLAMQRVIDGLEWEVHEETRNSASALFTITVRTNTVRSRDLVRRQLVGAGYVETDT